MSDPTPRVTLASASKWYGEVLGLNDVTVDFGPGVHGLLGPNGAGKSTFLKLVCGMLRPSLGSVSVCGRDPATQPGVMRRVGIVPEQDAVYAKVPILDVITYLTRLQGFGRADAKTRARRALEHVGLGDVLHRSAAGFSKGMRQRAKLAQALAHGPDVLILDEPLNGLDPTGRREYGDLLREQGDQGACVIVSSHILHEVAGLARRIVVLYGGRILADGTAREIREDLSEFPLTVRVDTTHVGDLASRLVMLDGVERVSRRPGGLEIRTRQPDALFDHLAQASLEGVGIERVVPTDEDLEAVFHYLIGGPVGGGSS